jgi:hypothetical protein
MIALGVTAAVRSREAAAGAVDALLARMPDDDPAKARLRERARAHAQDCGCAMGAAFMSVVLVAAPVWLLATGGMRVGALVVAVALVFVAAMVGKAAGLLLAHARLVVMLRSLERRAEPWGARHVHVH